ncbi:MAG: hypothetical protein ISS94_01660 [Candidatus Syntrophoarchaeum sp.]|nr:hypothetical protein [Methanomicrobia archaeon]MBL7117478.1 hypothetical protein [Candidatus Syntrophoarchaeum sp.]
MVEIPELPKKEAQKIEDLKRKYKGLWLAIKVVDRDEQGIPETGELVAKAKTHRELHLAMDDENVYETYAGDVPTKAVLF